MNKVLSEYSRPRGKQTMLSRYIRKGALASAAYASGLLVADATSAAAQSEALLFNDVRVVGNEYMTEEEVLDLCAITEERYYNDESLQVVLECLGESGRFREISLGTDARDLIITVDESPNYTGFLDISVSADTDRGISGRLEVQDRDLFGRGLLGVFDIEAAQEEQSARVMFANPDLWGWGFSGGMTLNFQNVDYDDQDYSYSRAVLAGFVEMPLAAQQALTLSVGLQRDEMFNIGATTTPILKREQGERLSPFLSFEYGAAFAPRVVPNTRIELQARQAFFGVGEDHLFSNTRLRIHAATEAIPDRLNLSFRLEAGHIEVLAYEGPLAMDRFQLGGTDLRGFSPRGIGPIDGGERLGGTSLAAFRFDADTRLAQFGHFEVEGGVFVDIGAVWGLEDTAGFTNPVDSSLQWRSAAGVSVTANIGPVPVTIYYAEPIRSVPGDSIQQFGLAMQTRF
jgi:outer membrane protein insertion porin family